MGAARAQSEAGKRDKAMEIMDVTPAAVDEALRASGLRLLIHGHTHRPAVHRFMLDGEAAERWVLPDWDFDASPARGGAIALRDGELVNLPLAG
jgi:UDP-2,3-diacylglucosamine hydrolase